MLALFFMCRYAHNLFASSLAITLTNYFAGAGASVAAGAVASVAAGAVASVAAGAVASVAAGAVAAGVESSLLLQADKARVEIMIISAEIFFTVSDPLIQIVMIIVVI